MNRQDDHVVFEELAAGHALSALEPGEGQRFAAHLATCTRCQRDVADHEATLALLAYAADPVEPPSSVLEGIRAGLPARGSAGLPPGPESPVPARPVAEQPGPQVASLAVARERRDRRTASAVRWLGAAAAAALVVSLGAWNLSLRAGQQDAQEYGERLAVAVRDLASPGSRNVPLTSENGRVLAVAVVQDRDVSLVVDGLPPNDSATTYVLWAQDGTGAVRPVGGFDVDEAQVDVVTDLPVGEGADSVTAFMLSKEKGDVAPAQPGAPVLASGEV